MKASSLQAQRDPQEAHKQCSLAAACVALCPASTAKFAAPNSGWAAKATRGGDKPSYYTQNQGSWFKTDSEMPIETTALASS